MLYIDYNKYRLFPIVSLLVMTMIFTIQFFLEDIPMDSVLYGFFISLFLLVVVTIVDVIKYKKEVSKLKSILAHLDLIEVTSISTCH